MDRATETQLGNRTRSRFGHYGTQVSTSPSGLEWHWTAPLTNLRQQRDERCPRLEFASTQQAEQAVHHLALIHPVQDDAVPIAEIIYEAVQHGIASSTTSKVKLRLNGPIVGCQPVIFL
jgi:hypothetical protein